MGRGGATGGVAENPTKEMRRGGGWRWGFHLAKQAVGATVAVVVEDDFLARPYEARDRRESRHPRAEGKRLVPVLQLADLLTFRHTWFEKKK